MIISTPLACCSITYSAAQLLIASAQLAYPTYIAAVWHVYLVYLAMMFLSYVIICLPTRYVSWFNIWASALGIVVLIVTTILLPAKANELNSGKDIFTSVCFLSHYLLSINSYSSLQVYNQTGWPAGWAFCMTFLSATWTLSGYDVAAHVAEETSHPAITVPRAMIWSTWSSAGLGFVYLISLALCATDIDALMANPLGQPIGTLTANILGEKAGVALLAINFISQFGCGVAFVSSPLPIRMSALLSQHTVRHGVPHLLRIQPRQGAAVLRLAEQDRQAHADAEQRVARRLFALGRLWRDLDWLGHRVRGVLLGQHPLGPDIVHSPRARALSVRG